MKIGDEVEISRSDAPQFGMVGRITALRVGIEWWIRMEDGHMLSWLESSMKVLVPEHELALRSLGEEYFA